MKIFIIATLLCLCGAITALPLPGSSNLMAKQNRASNHLQSYFGVSITRKSKSLFVDMLQEWAMAGNGRLRCIDRGCTSIAEGETLKTVAYDKTKDISTHQ
jgi:hypothetical protein